MKCMIRVGVVGAGGMAQNHLQNVTEMDDAEIVAVCDIVQENAEKATQQYGGKAFSNFEEMLDNEPLDALFLCVPPFAHGEMEEQAASRGIHVLVEKPVG